MRLNVLQHKRSPRATATRADEVDVQALETELRRAMAGEVRFDTGSRALYATDASNYRQTPIGIVVPRSVEDVVAAGRVCHRHGAPITSRGAGTSLAGAACNVAVILDCSKYLNRILEIDPQRRTARVQPGAILDDLRSAAGEYGLTFAPDPSTHAYCTLGGMIGTNACGVHSVMAGRTSDCVEALEVLTHDGQRLRVGATDDQTLEQLIAGGGRQGEIYAGLKAIRDEYADRIRAAYPGIPRRVSGYNLDELLPEKGFQVARALVGTEGTCVTVLEATLRLVPSPPVRTLLVLGYKDVYEAGDHVPQVLEFNPTGLEGMDEQLVAFMHKKDLHREYAGALPDGGGWLLVEFGGDTKEQANDRARRCMDALADGPNTPAMRLFDAPADAERIWQIRESGLGATAFVPGMRDTWPGWEDAAVDPANLGDYLRDFRTLLNKFDYACSLYGHFGDGCVHCRIDFDFTTRDGIDHYRAFLDEATDLVARYNGSFTAEHGDGQARAIFLPKLFGRELMDAHRRFKRLWDPGWKMNPGKVIDPDPPDANLRLGVGYKPWEPKTHYQWPDDERQFSRAALRCVGVGLCRRTEKAFMCPSFLVTREEKHTTRGRAHLLFEMLQGETITDGWKSETVHEALDLCVGCKGCKTDCPVDVDMAAYKEEFLSHYHAGRVRPRSHYAMGLIDLWAQLASWTPGLANAVARTPPLSVAAKWLTGVAQARELPAFAAEPFTRWYRRRRRHRPATSEPTVMLYPDVFNNYFHPSTLRHALDALEQLGYHVELPAHVPPAIRPRLHYGMLASAKRLLRREVEGLRRTSPADVAIIGLEPSTVSVFRDDLHSLFPDWQVGQQVGERVKLFSEFLVDEDVALPRLTGRAVLHNHCHHKAVLRHIASAQVLQRMGLDVVEPENGCCGMAGSFGYEAAHYEIATAIGERNLFPAMREADGDALLIADGFSCRHQVSAGAGRAPMHLAEAVAMALREGKLHYREALPEPAPRLSVPAATIAGAALFAMAALSVRWTRDRRRGQ